MAGVSDPALHGDRIEALDDLAGRSDVPGAALALDLLLRVRGPEREVALDRPHFSGFEIFDL
jgi:hypothetical protein